MAKMNFNKTETALDDLLQSMTKKKLLEMADQASGKIINDGSLETKGLFLLALQVELRYLKKEHPNIYKKFKKDSEWIKQLVSNPEDVSKEDWQKALDFKKNLDNLLKEVLEKMPDEQLIEKERRKHINKRINVNEKWLPL